MTLPLAQSFNSPQMLLFFLGDSNIIVESRAEQCGTVLLLLQELQAPACIPVTV